MTHGQRRRNPRGPDIRAYIEVFASGLKETEAQFRRFGNTLGGLGKSLLGAGIGAAVPLVAASKAFESFEVRMARVRAITNATDADFAKLGDKAKQLGLDTVFSASDAAEAMGNFAQAGFSVNEIMLAVGPTLDLAATAQISVAESASIASKVMRGMGIDAKDLGGVIDVMAKAATTSNTDIVQLGDAFRFVGPIAKTAGVSLEEITASIQLLSNAGIQGEMAGTTLRGMILSLTSPSSEAADELARLGVSVNDAKGNFRGIAPIVGDLEKSLAGVGTGKRLESLGKIFPARSAAGAAVLTAQGAERLAKATDALGHSSGTASRIAKTQLDTLFGAVKLFESSLEGLGIVLGEALVPALREWGAALVEVTNAFAAVVKNNKSFFLGLAKGILVVVGAGAAFIAAGLAIKTLAFGFGIAVAAIRAATTVILAVNAAFRLLTVAINLASVATTVFGALSTIIGALLTPVGLLTVGLIALTTWLIHTGKAGELLAGLGDAFKVLQADAMAAFGGIAEALKAGDLASAGKVVVALFKLEWVRLSQYLHSLWDDWGNAFLDVFNGAAFQISAAMVDVWSGLQVGFIGAIGVIQDAWTVMIGFLKPLWIAFAGVLEEVAVRAQNALNPYQAGHEAQRVQDETAAKVKAAQEETPAKLKADQLARGQQILGIDAERQAQLQSLADQQAAEAAGRRRPAGADAAELKAAEDALAEAIAAAAPKVAGAGGEAAGGAAGATDGFREITPDGIDRGLRHARANVEATSTFSAAAVAGLGVGGSLAQRQLDETKEQTKEIRKLRQEAKDRDEYS